MILGTKLLLLIRILSATFPLLAASLGEIIYLFIYLFRGLLTLHFYNTLRHFQQLTPIILFVCIHGRFWSDLQNILEIYKIDRTLK